MGTIVPPPWVDRCGDSRKSLKWRRDWDSNPGASFPANGFQDRRLRPLGHPS